MTLAIAMPRRLRLLAAAALLPVALTAAAEAHLLCGLVCPHGEAAMRAADICRGARP